MEKSNKKKSVRAIPEGYSTVTPYLVVDRAEKLIEFIKNAFDGQETFMMKRDEHSIMHATVKVGDSTIMISDTMEGMAPQTSMLYLYLENVDEVYKKALKAKATVVHEPSDEFYGDRAAAVKDEWGNVWWIATHVEDVDEAEMERRSKEFLKEQQKKGTEAHV